MKEIRTCELRAQAPAGAEGMTLVGTPIVYEQPTTINDPAGAFTEIIRRGRWTARICPTCGCSTTTISTVCPWPGRPAP